MNPRLNKALWTLLITLGGLVGVMAVMVAVTIVFDRFGGCFKLYRETGATPWHRPETVMTAEHSGHFSDDEINAAMQSVMNAYENEMYSYNGLYLTELTYDDKFSEIFRNDSESENDRIYLRSVLKTGYSSDMEGSWGRGRVYTAGYWTLEQQPDGSWKCLGWGQA